MDAIKIYNTSGTLHKSITKVLSSSFYESLDGVMSFRFATEAKRIYGTKKGFMVEFRGQYYRIVRHGKDNSGGLMVYTIDCEHISYILNDDNYEFESFEFDGTPSDALGKVLSGTPFSVGVVEKTSQISINFKNKINRRKVLMQIVALAGGEIEYSGYKINIRSHRGNTTRKLVGSADQRMSHISETSDLRSDTVSQELTFLRESGFKVGDEIKINFSPLEINSDTRIISIEYDPFYSIEINASVGDYIPEILDMYSETDNQLSEHDQRLADAEDSISDAKEGFDSKITTQSSTLRQEIADAKQAAITDSTSFTTTQIEAVNGTIGTINAGLLSITGEIDSLEYTITTQASTLRQEISDAQQASISASTSFTTEQIATVNGKITNINTDLLSLSGNITSLDSKITTQASTLRQEISDAKQAAISDSTSYTTTQVATVNGKITNLNTDLLSLSGTVDSISDDVDSISGDISSLESTITTQAATLRQEISDAKQAAINQSTSYTSEQITTINGKITTINTSLLSISGDIDSLESQITTQASTLRQEISTAKQAAISDSTSFTTTQISTVNGKITNLNTEFDEWTSDAEIRMNSFKTEAQVKTIITQESTQSGGSIKSAIEGYRYLTEAGADNTFVSKTSLNTSIAQYIDTTAGTAKIVSAVSATYQTKAGMSAYATTASITQEVSTQVAKITLSTSTSTASNQTTSTITLKNGSTTLSNVSVTGTTAAQVSTITSSAINGIALSVSNGTGSSTFTLKSGSTTLSSGTITFSGIVTFNDLSSSSSSTVINGNLIKTGKISADYIDVTNLTVSKLYVEASTTRIAISAGTNDVYVGGTYSSAGFSYVYLMASTRVYMQSSSSTSNGISFDPSTATIVSIGATGSIGNSSRSFGYGYFERLYTQNLYINNTLVTPISATDVKRLYYSTSYYVEYNSSHQLISNYSSPSLGSSSYKWSTGYITTLESSTVRADSVLPGTSYGSKYIGGSSNYWDYVYIGSTQVTLGSSSSSRVGFYGSTGSTRQSLTALSSSATLSNVIDGVNKIRTILVGLGLVS